MSCWWKWIILYLRSLTVFEEKIETFLNFFSKVYMHFFFMCSLIDSCQIVTDTCKNNVSKFVWKPHKSPTSLCKQKCFGEAFLFSLHYLHLDYNLLVTNNAQIGLKNLAIIGQLVILYNNETCFKHGLNLHKKSSLVLIESFHFMWPFITGGRQHKQAVVTHSKKFGTLTTDH